MSDQSDQIVETEVVKTVMSKELPKQVYCTHCNKLPGYIKAVGDADEVYHALECDCKQTPYMRSNTFVDATWNSVTYAQTPKEAYEIAVKQSPEWTNISVPSHAK